MLSERVIECHMIGMQVATKTLYAVLLSNMKYCTYFN